MLGQHRSTQRRVPTRPDDEERLTADIVELARRHALAIGRSQRCCVRPPGWIVNDKRVERIWRREGLKVPAKQSKQGRIWFADGSCIRLRINAPTMSGPMTSSRIARTMGGSYRTVSTSSTSSARMSGHPGRPETQVRRRDRQCCLDQFVLRGVPEHIAIRQRTRVRRTRRCGIGSEPWGFRRPTLSGASRLAERLHCRASTPRFATNCLMERSSTRLPRPGSSSRAGGATTTPRGRTDP